MGEDRPQVLMVLVTPSHFQQDLSTAMTNAEHFKQGKLRHGQEAPVTGLCGGGDKKRSNTSVGQVLELRSSPNFPSLPLLLLQRSWALEDG